MAQNLTTNIVINAKTGNGFSQVGATLTELGSLVNGISQKLINFGEDSVKVYRDYEKSMREAEVALSTTYGRNTQELARVMRELDESATDWAATTIFHTDDVANAISEAAHAGWDMNQILTGLPAAMQLAQAGSLDLSEAVNYIVKSTNAAGIEFEDLTEFTDLWTFAANSSASTIGEFGDAMLRMGSTMRFTDSTEELMTLIAMTANAGSVGSEAGTMIRNSIMRLIAPTQKADKAMGELGATSEETAELLNNEALAAANAELAAHGFSAFNASGEMKSVLDIYNELYVALGEIAGGYENIEKNESALSILSSIFPTRTITEALNLLRAAANEYDGLYDAMRGGAATGYGAYAAETMMDTLNGRIETFNSKVERLKQVVGAELAPQLGGVLDFAGDLVDSLAEMDPDLFSALVNGLEVIAGVGPGLLLAGGAMRLIGALATPVGAAATAAILAAAAIKGLSDLNNSNYLEQFGGNMSLDAGEILSYFSAIDEGFNQVYDDMFKFRSYVDEAVLSYQNASAELSSGLFTAMITGATLTDEDKTNLQNAADEMLYQVQTAIASSAASSQNYLQTLYGGEGTAENNPVYLGLMELTQSGYEQAMAEAEGIGNELRNALTEAFSDGELSSDEYQKILSYFRSYNQALAKAKLEAEGDADYAKLMRTLESAYTASGEEFYELVGNITEQRDAQIAQWEEYHSDEYWAKQRQGATESQLADLRARQDADIAARRKQYDEGILNAFESQILSSGQGENYTWLEGIARQYTQGNISAETANELINKQLGKSGYADQSYIGNPFVDSDREALGRETGSAIFALGGEEQVQKLIADYTAAGDYDTAQRFQSMLVAELLANDFQTVTKADAKGFSTKATGFLKSNSPLLGILTDPRTTGLYEGGGLSYESSEFFRTIGEQAAEGNGSIAQGAWYQISKEAQTQALSFVDQLSGIYDFDKVLAGNNSPWAELDNGFRDYLATYELLFGEASKHLEDFKINVEPEVNTAGIEEKIPDSTQITVEPVVEGADSIDSIGDNGIQLSVSTDTSQAAGDIADLDGQQITTMVDGDTSDLQGDISQQDNRHVTTHVDGNTANLSKAISAQNGRHIVTYVNGNTYPLKTAIDSQDQRHITVIVDQVAGTKVGYASGGRATTASIFGEAGPEWAIPEQHTQRTAELLNAAREASGFTWGDLLARFGGLNANPQNVPATIVYSPTVHAADARGVDAVLREDKKRLQRWFEEKQLLDRVEVYA